MAKDFQINYNSFLGGLNNRLAPHLLQPNEAQIAQNLDLSSGVLKPMKDLGASIFNFYNYAFPSGPSGDLSWIWYASSTEWRGDTRRHFALNDGGGKTYYTENNSRPYVHRAGTSSDSVYKLGIKPITAANWSTTVGSDPLTGQYQYAFTFVTRDGLESNPQTFELSLPLDQGSVTFSNFTISDNPTVIGRNVYRTTKNGSIFYYLTTIEGNDESSWTDKLKDEYLEYSRPLTWSIGGWSGSGGQYVEDHSPPPNLTVLSDNLHASNGAVGSSGSGILFGAEGTTARWSMLGFTDYWPTVNSFSLIDTIESITSSGAATYFLTTEAIYQVTGNSDDSVNFTKTSANLGVYPGYGFITKQTPYGTIYLTREGLALFDGTRSQLLAAGKLRRDYFDPTAVTIYASGFYENKFYMFCSTETVIFDMTDGLGDMRITTSTHLIRSATNAVSTTQSVAEKFSSLPGPVSNVIVNKGGSYLNIPKIKFESNDKNIKGGQYFTPTFSIDRVDVEPPVGNGTLKSPPTLVVPAPSSGGTTAKLSAVIMNGKVTSVIVDEPGEGYTEIPTITSIPGHTFYVYVTVTGVQLKSRSLKHFVNDPQPESVTPLTQNNNNYANLAVSDSADDHAYDAAMIWIDARHVTYGVKARRILTIRDSQTLSGNYKTVFFDNIGNLNYSTNPSIPDYKILPTGTFTSAPKLALVPQPYTGKWPLTFVGSGTGAQGYVTFTNGVMTGTPTITKNGTGYNRSSTGVAIAETNNGNFFASGSSAALIVASYTVNNGVASVSISSAGSNYSVVSEEASLVAEVTPSKVWNSAVGYSNGNIYNFGGNSIFMPSPGQMTTMSIDRYNVASKKWERLNDRFPSSAGYNASGNIDYPRSAGGHGDTIGKYIYLIRGGNTFSRYDAYQNFAEDLISFSETATNDCILNDPGDTFSPQGESSLMRYNPDRDWVTKIENVNLDNAYNAAHSEGVFATYGTGYGQIRPYSSFTFDPLAAGHNTSLGYGDAYVIGGSFRGISNGAGGISGAGRNLSSAINAAYGGTAFSSNDFKDLQILRCRITSTGYSTSGSLVHGANYSTQSRIASLSYSLVNHRSVYYNGKIYCFGGIKGNGTLGWNGTYNSDVVIYDIASNTITYDTTGPAAGWTARTGTTVNLVINNGTPYIMLYGGENASGIISEMWIYRPDLVNLSTGAQWSSKITNINGLPELSYAGSVVVSDDLYLIGGKTSTSPTGTGDMYRVPVSQLLDTSTGFTPGMYVSPVEPTGTTRYIKRFEGGSRMSSWKWRGRLEVGAKPGPLLTLLRARISSAGNLTIKTTPDNTTLTLQKTLTSTVLTGVQRFWFTSSSTRPKGQKLAIEIEGTNSSAELHRLEIDAKQDGDVG